LFVKLAHKITKRKGKLGCICDFDTFKDCSDNNLLIEGPK